jgi:hypothetical protein
MILSDETKRKSLISAGKKHIEQFEPNVVAERLNDVYTTLVPERTIV